MVQQFVFYLNKYQVLPNFQLKGEKGEVQAHLVLMQHCKSSLVQVDKVVVGEVIATVSATIKIHILFYKHFKLVKTLYIVPKGENIAFISNAFKKYNEYAFSSTSTIKKEDRKLQNVNLIKSRKYRHMRKVSCATQGKVGETTKSRYLP